RRACASPGGGLGSIGWRPPGRHPRNRCKTGSAPGRGAPCPLLLQSRPSDRLRHTSDSRPGTSSNQRAAVHENDRAKPELLLGTRLSCVLVADEPNRFAAWRLLTSRVRSRIG